MIIDPEKCSNCGHSYQPWLVWDGDETLVMDCCGATKPLSPALYLLQFGKYEGKTIDEVTDEWYLTFLKKLAVEKGDGLLLKVLEIKARK